MFTTFATECHNNFRNDLTNKGWFVANNFVRDMNFLNKIKALVGDSIAEYRKEQVNKGIAKEINKGTVHHTLVKEKLVLQLLDGLMSEFDAAIQSFFGGKYILNTIGGNFLKQVTPYYGLIHRDVRSHTRDINLMCQLLIPLDDFTESNGATQILTGSHKIKSKPSQKFFRANADKAVAKCGSLIFFNSNCWHAAGPNQSAGDRASIIITLSAPFMKPQFDYVRYLEGKGKPNLSENLRQLLGYYARIPSTLEEWVQPVEKRMYRNNQETEYYKKYDD